MSWSIHGIDNTPALEAVSKLSALNLPEGIRSYCVEGIEGLASIKGTHDFNVSVSGHGHLTKGEGSYAVTSANLEIKEVFAEGADLSHAPA